MIAIEDIWKAQGVIQDYIEHTPLLRSRTLGGLCGATLYLKAENLQRSGSFKIRGAMYKLSRLSEDARKRGVIAASAGNHAQGLAIAAAELGIPCTIVMPSSASIIKISATRGYGADVVLYGDDYGMAARRAREIEVQTGATYIHGFDDPDIIAGQGTLGLEILDDLPNVEAVVVGIGGGGLIAGIATAIKALRPEVLVYGVQATGAASMRAALDHGSVVALESVSTVADGIAIPAVGEQPLAITRSLVDDVVTVDDEEIVHAMLLLLERGKLLVEGAGAAAVAACLSGKLDLTNRRVVAVLSGGNIDTNQVDRFIQHGLSAQGRYLVLHVTFPDRPGELLRLLKLVSGQNANVLDVEHRRTGLALPINQVEVVLTLEMRDRAHCESLLAVLNRHKVAFREERATVGSLPP